MACITFRIMNAIEQYKDLKRRMDGLKRGGDFIDTDREWRLSKLLAVCPNNVFTWSDCLYCLHDATLWIDGENMGPLDKVDWDAVSKKGTPAPFGHGEETKVDSEVRDALEIPASRFQFKNESKGEVVKHWRELALPELDITDIRPYKLQIYRKGGHFKPHRDTIHGEDHMATQLVFMPSEFEGGDLVVRRDGREFRANEGACLFYTDCEHEVEPVTEGIRVTLQLDVFGHATAAHVTDSAGLSQTSADDSEVPSSRIEGLKEALDEYWEEEDRTNVTFLLRHDYTRKTLDPTQLRGFDSTLFKSLQALGYNPVLHLCIVHREGKDYECNVVDSSSLERVDYPGSNAVVLCAPPVPVRELERTSGGYTGNEAVESTTTYYSACLMVTNNNKKCKSDSQVDEGTEQMQEPDDNH